MSILSTSLIPVLSNLILFYVFFINYHVHTITNNNKSLNNITNDQLYEKPNQLFIQSLPPTAKAPPITAQTRIMKDEKLSLVI